MNNLQKIDYFHYQLSSALGGWRTADLLDELRILLVQHEAEMEEEEDTLDRRRRRRLQEAQLIAAWAGYREALQALRERLEREREDAEDALGVLVAFVIEHLAALQVVGIRLAPVIKKMASGEGVALAGSEAWQTWLVSWLADWLPPDEPGGAPEPSPSPAPTSEPEDPVEVYANDI